MPEQLGPADAVIIVDVQKDFCPGGALGVADCGRMIDVLNRWIDAALQSGSPVVASRDWHPPGHSSFLEQGGPWPVHCVAATDGARFHTDLQLPDDVEIVDKGTRKEADAYSAFEETGLVNRLNEWGVQRVWIGGLVLDVCVRATALDALLAGFETYVIREGTVAFNEANGIRTVAELLTAGVGIVESD